MPHRDRPPYLLIRLTFPAALPGLNNRQILNFSNLALFPWGHYPPALFPPIHFPPFRFSPGPVPLSVVQRVRLSFPCSAILKPLYGLFRKLVYLFVRRRWQKAGSNPRSRQIHGNTWLLFRPGLVVCSQVPCLCSVLAQIYGFSRTRPKVKKYPFGRSYNNRLVTA